MALTPRRLNRATLARQLLLRREPLDVCEGTRRIAAMQAQEAASPYLALWNRLAPFDPADLDAAFAGHTLVKAPLMRITLHAVHREDFPAFHHAMVGALRASRLHDRRFTATGLSVADADALVPHVLEFATVPRSGAEIEEMLEKRLGERKPELWWALRTFAPLVHAPAGGPWSFTTRPSYRSADVPPPTQSRVGYLLHLVRRYLAAFGPASVADISQFTLLARSSVRSALDTVDGELRELTGSDGTPLYDVPGAPVPDEDTPAPPRLLPMWDSVMLAYRDRSRVIPPDYRRLVIRRNGDVLPTLLVDGYVAGVWRPVEAGIAATAFHPLPDEAWTGLAAEAGALRTLLGERDPQVYRRYARWWDELPAGETRVLPG